MLFISGILVNERLVGGGDDTPQTKLGCICHAFGGLPFDFNSSSSCHRMLYCERDCFLLCHLID